MGFVKSGNLPMLKALVEEYKLGMSVILLKGCSDQFNFSPTENMSMKDWNPLLVAIAFKRVEIVRYLLQDLKISFRHASRDPDI
jgi:hypothetical protein